MGGDGKETAETAGEKGWCSGESVVGALPEDVDSRTKRTEE